MANLTPKLYIYDASAGSGKTFTLVKEYLKKLLLAESIDYYKKILAITFTNKAVGEMKERIVEQLVAFADKKIVENPGDMQVVIAKETQLSHKEIHDKSKQILKSLLHDYSGFSVETIDSFNHRIIRTFAKDLKLNSNFEVDLDANSLLEEAVDRLIARAGQDKKVTEYLLRYAKSQLQQDKSWNIRDEIIETSRLLLSENHKRSIDNLKSHDLKDFNKFAEQLKKNENQNYKQIEDIAKKTLDLLYTMEIPEDAIRNTYNNFLKKAATDSKSLNFKTRPKWHEDIENGIFSFHLSKTQEIHKQQLDSIQKELSDVFLEARRLIQQNDVYRLVLRELLPMALINLVANELQQIQQEQDILLIADFNYLLNEQVKNQPAPFIYERLGERYRHFFVDEFQDTSQLQWENMLPLMDNTLSQNFENSQPGSVMLVGDAKQSIYRWRGGYPEQFIYLTRKENPFQIDKEQKKIIHLDTNYRSAENIIDFNNKFFSYIADILKNTTYKELYIQGNQQKFNKEKGGYIRIDRLPKATEEQTTQQLYQEKVIEIIQELKEGNVKLSDICILVRKNNQGVVISEALMEKEIPFVSSETLLLKNSKEVNALLDCLRLLLFPSDKEVRVKLCYFLYDSLDIKEDKHLFLQKLIKPDSLWEFLKILSTYGVDIDIQEITQVSLYQSFEILIKQLKIDKFSSAYLFSFMDFVHSYEQSKATTKHLFFDYWNSKADQLSIPSSRDTEAVQVMTIHKAKGLEFPIVIVPFCNNKLGDLSKTKDWLPWQEEEAFKEVYVSINDSLERYNQEYKEKYEELFEKEVLDELNTIYVAFTRASTDLYILTDKRQNFNKGYLLCDKLQEFVVSKGGSLEDGESYSFGESTLVENVEENIVEEKTIVPEYILTRPELLDIVTSKADLWNTKMEEAIAYGTEIHGILENIETSLEVKPYFEQLSIQKNIPLVKLESLRKIVVEIVSHEDLKHLFSSADSVYTELDIVTSNKKIQRVDRLNFHEDNTVTLLDYKTGEPKPQDIAQIQSYEKVLKEMGISLKEKLLVYIDSNTVVVNKV